MRVAIVAESFLPEVNGVTNSVLRVLEHLEAQGHDALVVAPGDGPERCGHARVVRTPAVALPLYRSLPVGLPTAEVRRHLDAFRPDVVHLAAPVVLGAAGAVAARRLGIPAVAVYQTDLAGFASRYRKTVKGISPAAFHLVIRNRWAGEYQDALRGAGGKASQYTPAVTTRAPRSCRVSGAHGHLRYVIRINDGSRHGSAR